jgi:glycosyltransferase involved in cell wall biosynthesis
MRIGINASWMTPGHVGGMEWYVRNLVAQLGAIDQDHDYVLVTAPNNQATFQLPSPRWKKVVYAGHENSPTVFRVADRTAAPSGGRRQWLRRAYRLLRRPWARGSTRALSDLIRGEGVDLWFCPLIYALPLDASVPIVTTIPDLQHEYYPDFFTEEDFALRAVGYPYSCRVATATIGISRHVANEIVRLYDIPAERVFSTPLALDPSYQLPPMAIDRLVNAARLKFRIDYDFILYPANGWKHKNHEALIEALHIVRDRHPRLNLVLIGCEFDVLDRIRPLIKRYRLQPAVRHLGYVSRDDLIGLYAACKLLVFPSLFEGFGLPLLEAMHFGVPVACSNVTSLPEVGGDAVLYFDPRAPDQIAQAIDRGLEDHDLRSRLVAAGRAQASRFSYARTAKSTLAVFNKVGGGELLPPRLPPFRPPIAHNWLDDGHSRWYFRAGPAFTIHVDLVQPTLLERLKEQRVEVRLDGQTVAAAAIDPQRLHHLIHTFRNGAASALHALEIVASSHATVGASVLSVQVPSLRIIDSDGRELRLTR